MASTALEEKINKIRLRNEEIKRRYEEVEADKKNAAKLDALVEPVPSEDWPERKEPPEFSAPVPKHTNKQRHSVRKHNDQYHTGSGEGKKAHNFGDGQGPPPDPKYNFLADSEREEHGEEIPRDTERNRGRNKPTRGIFKRRGSGRDWHSKEQWNQQSSPGELTRPEYEAWRAERNRIDEARISRQRTAEGNWRREWDNDKIHLADEVSKRENRVTLGDVATRQEHSDTDKLYRSPRSAPRITQHSNAREAYHGSTVSDANKSHGCVNDPEKRVVIATDRSIKVMLNPGSTTPKSSVMSVKVSPPNIAGTGRVGPRQRPRVMYSSQSDAEISTHETPNFTRQKSVDEKSKSRPFDQSQKVVSPKSPHPQRKRDSDPKSPYPQRRDNDRGDKFDGTSKSSKKDSQKSPYPQRRGNTPGNYPPKSPRVHRRSTEGVKNETTKLPQTQQERNRETCNRSSVSEETKSGDVPLSANDDAANTDDKSNELLSQMDTNDNKNENVPIKQSPSEGSTSAEALVSDRNYSTENSVKNDSELFVESSLESSTRSEETSANSAYLDSDKTIIPDKLTTNDEEPLEETSLELSMNPTQADLPIAETAANASDLGLESGENCVIDRSNEDEAALLGKASLEASKSPVVGVSCSAEKNTSMESKEIYGEASGSQEPSNTSSDDINPGSSDRAAINCSANSELNDSGFTELPSNDSIHDISANGNVETSDFAETSMDSIQSGNEENRPIVQHLEVESKVADAAADNIAEPSSSGLEKTVQNLSSAPKENLHDEPIDNGNVLTQRASEIVKTTSATDEADNNLEKNSASSIVHEEADNNFEKDSASSIVNKEADNNLEKDSASSSIVRKETDNNADLMENDSVESPSKLESQEKNIVKSVCQSNTVKSEEKVLEISEKAAVLVKDAQESSVDSAIVSEISNKVANDEEEKLKDCSIIESSDSISPNDIKKESAVESAIANTLSSPAAEKAEAFDKQVS